MNDKNNVKFDYPETFPEHVDFTWIENTGEPSEIGIFKTIMTRMMLLNGRGVIFGSRLFTQTTYKKLNFTKELLEFCYNIFKLKTKKADNIYILTDIWSTGPYHFYVDVMSKIVKLIEEGYLYQRNAKIVLFEDNFTTQVVEPLLLNLGLKDLEIFKIKRNGYYLFVGRNYYVTKPHFMGSNNPLVIRNVKDLIDRNLLRIKKRSSLFKKMYSGIYYSRSGFNRKVENDIQLIRVLETKGFYSTSFEDLSYLEAFELMQSSTLFVGIHGGGLTNMMFMRPGSNIIEIKTNNPHPKNHCYWYLARSLGYNYKMFVAKSTDPQNNAIEGKGCDVLVDIDSLVLLIDRVIDSKSQEKLTKFVLD
jgi:hypothetical protein